MISINIAVANICEEKKIKYIFFIIIYYYLNTSWASPTPVGR